MKETHILWYPDKYKYRYMKPEKDLQSADLRQKAHFPTYCDLQPKQPCVFMYRERGAPESN